MTTPASQQYSIPSVKLQPAGCLPIMPLLLCPIILAAIGARVSLDRAVDLGMVGFAIGMVLTFVCTGVAIGRRKRRAQAIWSAHNHAWYRTTFPQHAHPHGKVSCRHCGGDRLQVSSLMNHSYTRMHACSHCGETLYFSPERI